MKNKIIKTISFLLVVFQLLLLGACADTGGINDDTSTGADDSNVSDTGENNSNVFSLLGSDGSPLYTIIRAESAGQELISAAVSFNKTISESAGGSFKIATDWVKNESDIDDDAYEILIGQTNRSASVTAAAELALSDYIITVSGNKIVICGGSDEATINALSYFTEHCLQLSTGSVKVAVEEKIEYHKEYLGMDFSIAGVPISAYSIIYSTSVEDEEGITIANQLNDFIVDNCGVSLDIKNDAKSASEYEIVIGNTTREESKTLYTNGFDTYDYKVELNGSKLIICGGSCFALYCGIKLLSENYMAKNVQLSSLSESGSMYGKYLYEREDGAEVRIMSNNVWQNDSNNAIWTNLGEDCSAKARSVGLAAVYMAYLPDVICFQEMSTLMITFIQKELAKCGYDYSLLCFTAGSDVDYTCILYRNDTVTLIDKGYHEYTYGCNGGTKSYTWGHFELKSTGEDFAALSTHLWYKSEADQAGSNSLREQQAAEVVSRTEKLAAQYNCPVFAMGDFNTKTLTDAFKVFIDGGFSNTYSLAEVYADNHRGYHSCNSTGYSRETSSGTYAENAIDHILLRNAGMTRILTFNHVRPYFYIKLSDHYPVYIDAILG